jgi:hypothetical protein
MSKLNPGAMESIQKLGQSNPTTVVVQMDQMYATMGRAVFGSHRVAQLDVISVMERVLDYPTMHTVKK